MMSLTAVLAVTILVVCGCGTARETGRHVTPVLDENTVVFLADLHTDPAGYQPEKLNVCIGEILKMDPLPANVVCLGDLAYLTGKPEEYAAVAECLAPLEKAGITLTLAMGNHDRRAAFAKAFPEHAAKSPVPGRMAGILVTPHLDFLILDSLQESPDSTKWITPGTLDEAQRTWLVKTLADYTKPVIVCSHHPVHELGIKKVLTSSPTCCGYIYGHDHVWRQDFEMYSYGRKQIVRTLCLPSTGHWGDIGFTVLKMDDTKAVATLRQLEFFFPNPEKDASKVPALWGHITADHDGDRCTFDYQVQ